MEKCLWIHKNTQDSTGLVSLAFSRTPVYTTMRYFLFSYSFFLDNL